MDGHWHLGEEDFFQDLELEKQAFMRLARRRDLKKNDIIFFEDDQGATCFYLEKGLIKIFQISFSGKEPIFFLRRGGEMFGLAEVLESVPRKANAQALVPCTLYEIGRREFESFLENNFRATRKVITTMGRRLRYLSDQIGSLMVCDVRTRLAKLLVYISYERLSSEESWQAPAIIPIKLTQDQMASMTGSCQQTISKFLKQFQEEELITIKNKKITIINPLKLLEKAEI
jgi:CRP-like cAMP-binding protein